MVDESYEGVKNVFNSVNTSSNSLLPLNASHINPLSMSLVLNNFRDNFDSFDTSSNVSNRQSLSDSLYNTESDFNNTVSANGDLTRFSNPVSLRFSAKNSIVAYNAYQKVFKLRFDDNRSNAKIESLSNLESPQPFVDGPRLSYESMLGKNKENFYNIALYKDTSLPFLSTLSSLQNALSFPFYDFPFELGEVNDMTRYR